MNYAATGTVLNAEFGMLMVDIVEAFDMLGHMALCIFTFGKAGERASLMLETTGEESGATYARPGLRMPCTSNSGLKCHQKC